MKKDYKDEAEFTQTGSLGDVMKESVEVVKIAVYNFLITDLSFTSSQFDHSAYHLHVPMGATPKDGPSAGVSIFAALISIATERPIRRNLAMTGEISTLGEAIAIGKYPPSNPTPGGIREKLTACKNHNITTVILPLSNKKHFDKLPLEFKSGFTIYFTRNIKQVYSVCFDEIINNEIEMVVFK